MRNADVSSSDSISISFLSRNIKWFGTVFISDIFFQEVPKPMLLCKRRSALHESSLEGLIGKILYQIHERSACCHGRMYLASGVWNSLRLALLTKGFCIQIINARIFSFENLCHCTRSVYVTMIKKRDSLSILQFGKATFCCILSRDQFECLPIKNPISISYHTIPASAFCAGILTIEDLYGYIVICHIN